MAAKSSGTFSPELWDALEKIRSAREYAPGVLLFTEGRPSSGLYVVESGVVRLSSIGCVANSIENAGPGSVLALSETVANQPHKITGEACEKVRVWFIARRDFLRFLRVHHAHCMEIVRILSNDLHTLYARVAGETARGRQDDLLQ